MDLKRLEYLMQVAEFGSFTKAASVIGIAQPALGRQIQKLESECGVRLLYRHGRGVILTPEGSKELRGLQQLNNQSKLADAAAFRRIVYQHGRNFTRYVRVLANGG